MFAIGITLILNQVWRASRLYSVLTVAHGLQIGKRGLDRTHRKLKRAFNTSAF